MQPLGNLGDGNTDVNQGKKRRKSQTLKLHPTGQHRERSQYNRVIDDEIDDGTSNSPGTTIEAESQNREQLLLQLT